MTVAAYTTDLTDIADFDTTGGTAVEPSSLWTAGRSPEEADTDNPIQGTVHGSLVMNTTGKAGILVPGETVWSTGDYIFGWIIWTAPGAIATYASGGLAMIVGDSASVFEVFYVGGKDFGLYPIGGWQNFAVDPAHANGPDENAGSPSTYDYIGCGANVLSQVAKGAPLMLDVFRCGRGEARVVGGTSTDADATFSGLAAVNDNNSNRWGLFQEIEGGYKFKGKLVIGYGAACDFTDSDKNIVIDNTEWVSSDFNRIELTNASSVINWTNINFTALGTVSKGQLEMMDNCTFTDLGGAFTDMDTFIYDSNADITGRTFRRCGQVTQGGGTFTDCVFDESTAAVALLVDSLVDVSGCIFNSDGTGHAVNLGTISTTQSISWNNTGNGYALQAGTDANKTILVNVASGQHLTIGVGAGYTTPSVYNTGTGTFEVINSVTVQVTVTDANTDSPINLAHVLLYLDSDKSTVVLSGATNSSGVVSDIFDYLSPVAVTGWARQWDLSGTDYTQKDISGTITSAGLALAVKLTPIN